MKKLFSILAVFVLVFSLAGPALAGNCADIGGDCEEPGFPNTGAVGTTTRPYGEGNFNVLRYAGFIDFQLAAAMVDGTGPITDSTTPNLATLDSIGKILYDDSAETTGIQWNFKVPMAYPSGAPAGIYALVSTSERCGTSIELDGQWWINGDEVAFDAAALAQDVFTGLNIDSDSSSELFDLSASSTVIAALTQGVWVTFELQNSAGASGTSCGAADTEIAAIGFYWERSGQ